MQKQTKPKQAPEQKNKKTITEQQRKVITQRMQLIHKNHPDCIPVLFLKHPQAPNNIKPPTTPFILFQKKWKIEQAMISLYNQIKQKGLYFFCPYLDKNKLKYSVLKPGPTIQQVYNKFGTGGYLTLVYSDGNLGMQEMDDKIIGDDNTDLGIFIWVLLLQQLLWANKQIIVQNQSGSYYLQQHIILIQNKLNNNLVQSYIYSKQQRQKMLNSNPNSLQTQAYTYFINKQYAQALQLYTQALKQPYLSSLSQLYLQTTIAIVYIQMNNYTQAHQMLVGLGQRVDIIVNNIRGNINGNSKNRNNRSFTSSTTKSNTDLLTYLLIYLKIEACLLVLQLANCNKNYVHAHLDKIFQIILYGDGFRDRLTLFRSVMLMLIGYGSFQDLYAQAQVKVSTNNYSNKTAMLTSSTTSILLSSLSMTLQLANNPQLAFQVQQKSFQTCKGEQKQIIPMLISCKHIIHLCDGIKNNSIKNSYIAQFQKLINTPQIYGISEQTLFRGYEDKIQCGKVVVQKIWQFQQNNIKNYYKNEYNGKYSQHMEQDIYLQWLHKRVVYRLQQTLYNIQNKQYQQYQDDRSGVNKTLSRESLIRCLNCLNNSKNGIHMLSYMKDSQLVQSVLKQQSGKIQKLFSCMKIIGYGMAWRQLVLLPPRPDYQQTQQNNPNEYNYKLFKNVTTRNPAKLQPNEKVEIRQQKYKKQGNNFSPNQTSQSINMNKNYKLDSRNVYQYQQQQEQTEDIAEEATNYRSNNKYINKKQNSRLDQSPYREVVSSKVRENQKQRSRYLDVQRQKQLERQREILKQREIRLKNQQLELEKQRKRLQQIKSMQDRQERQREELYVDRHQRKIEQRDESHQQRDYSKDEVKYYSNLQRTQRSPRPNRRLQHVNVIKKSPTNRNYRDISPTNPKHQTNQTPNQSNIQNSRINGSRLINNEINTSKIANNMNNVYLDSESSRYINPLNDLSYHKEVQDNVNLQEQNRQRQGKIGLSSKVQRRQIKNVKNPSTNQTINDNVMSILKSQNSRIKNTNQQINKITTNTNPNPIVQQQVSKQKDNSRENQYNSFSFNKQNTLIYGYGNTPAGNQSLNPNSFSPKPNSSIHQDISQINRSQEHVQFNNVDIVIQPAINPSNVSNLSMINSNLNNTNKIDYTIVDNRNILPDNFSRINQTPEVKPNVSPINQISNMYSPIKKTFSENQHKILPKLTPQSPYIQKLMKLCNEGQYFAKKNFSSDGGSEKFIQLYGNMVRWAVDEEKISSKYQSYKLKEIKGVIFGKVSDTFLKQCNKKLRPWLCFSLVLKNRTLDFCCSQQIDPSIWLPGLSAAISGQVLDLKYPKRKSKKQEQKVQKVPVTLFTPGKVLWKRIFMKLKQLYKRPKKGSVFRNPNAYAIVQWNKQFQKSKSKLQIQSKQ